ncbi:uncharacterized protein FA14DRAFT_160448 [Meira miltonrushii]|uniref:Uncharacterized protein n=1 Tax=Meira miltonrushii TaxID=1280837 RepID=A0A316VCA0_9BASI|nr:uncharacterized protein FA14DRAFT_160448 [Meira miltonrushii]PWN35192.1 hypothetical protein FA14DRAFT_160448 [Meira miltonrushii]
MYGLLSRTVFVRPTNMLITQPLQVLSIARELGKRSGNKLIRFRAAREPDQQRLLNFGSFTFQDSEAAGEIVYQTSTITVPINGRAASNYETLKFAPKKRQDQEIGLIEVASMVGLPLNISGRQVIRQKVEDETESQVASESELKYVLAPISQSLPEVSFQAEVKCERRQNASEKIRSGKGMFSKRYSFDSEAPIATRTLSRLDSAWEKFGGFTNRYQRKSVYREQQ